MAASVAENQWLKGRVKAVTSGDCLVITALTLNRPPPEKTITLSSFMAPKLARRRGIDEPFSWESREFLRKLCIGKEVTFKVERSYQSPKFFDLGILEMKKRYECCDVFCHK